MRGRVMPNLPIKQDFEYASLTETNAEGTSFAYPPLPWIGARFKFDVREKDGGKVLAKTIDNKFFQRATVFIGTPEMSNYTIQADVMSDGNRRKMSEVGLINQRYLVLLKGNEQKTGGQFQPGTPAGVPGFQVVPEHLVSAQSPGGHERGRLGGRPRQSLETGRSGAGQVDPRGAAPDRPSDRFARAVRLLAAGHARLHRQFGSHSQLEIRTTMKLLMICSQNLLCLGAVRFGGVSRPRPRIGRSGAAPTPATCIATPGICRNISPRTNPPR